MNPAVIAPERQVELPSPAYAPSSPREAPARARRHWALVAAVAFVAAAALIAAAWPTLFPQPVVQVVTASGRIEGRDVTLAAKSIQGRVARLLVDEGDTVRKGQLLAELDAAQIEAQVAAARATVSTLDAQVNQAALDVAYAGKIVDASIDAADAAFSTAQAHAARAAAIRENSTAAYQRVLALFGSGALSKQDLDAADTARRTTEADVSAADKEVARAAANVALARAATDTIGLKRQQLRALEESRRMVAARLEEAAANLAERRIVAPDAGTIVSRVVEVGDVVSPGAPIFHVVDMARLYVKVYVPEPDIAKLRLGAAADVFVDAFPGRRFGARISRIYEQAEFTPKNVETTEERLKLVFGVELAIDSAEGVLKPGMPADCVIHWSSQESERTGHGS